MSQTSSSSRAARWTVPDTSPSPRALARRPWSSAPSTPHTPHRSRVSLSRNRSEPDRPLVEPARRASASRAVSKPSAPTALVEPRRASVARPPRVETTREAAVFETKECVWWSRTWLSHGWFRRGSVSLTLARAGSTSSGGRLNQQWGPAQPAVGGDAVSSRGPAQPAVGRPDVAISSGTNCSAAVHAPWWPSSRDSRGS